MWLASVLHSQAGSAAVANGANRLSRKRDSSDPDALILRMPLVPPKNTGATSISTRVLEPPPAAVHRASGAARVHIRDNVNRCAPPSAEMPATALTPRARA